MLAAGLGGRDDREQGRRVPVAGGADPGYRGSALGDRAGLVQDDRGQPARLLERVTVADQDAELGGLAGAHMTAVGVARPSAQGQAMISTAMVVPIAMVQWLPADPVSAQTVNVMTAAIRTPG